MRCLILIFLFITILKATNVQINDVHDAHVNVQMGHEPIQQSRANMHGGQTSAGISHDKGQTNLGESSKETTKGTLNYHRTKKLHHRIAKEGYSDELQASIHGSNVELHDPQHPRTQYLKSKILEHGDGFAKHKAIIRDLKDGIKLPGKKNMQHLRDKDKMPPGYH